MKQGHRVNGLMEKGKNWHANILCELYSTAGDRGKTFSQSIPDGEKTQVFLCKNDTFNRNFPLPHNSCTEGHSSMLG